MYVFHSTYLGILGMQWDPNCSRLVGTEMSSVSVQPLTAVIRFRLFWKASGTFERGLPSFLGLIGTTTFRRDALARRRRPIGGQRRRIPGSVRQTYHNHGISKLMQSHIYKRLPIGHNCSINSHSIARALDGRRR